MTHKKIETPLAPRSLGPYSQAVKAGSLVFVSGQLPVDPATGIIPDEDIQKHTFRVLKNIEVILKEAGCTFEDVVKCEIFLIDLKRDFSQVNEIYGTFFNGKTPPARQTIQAAALPLDSRIEISCIAALPNEPKE